MALLKCNICGGELELNADMSVGTCQYCGSAVTIPKEIERKEKLYNRATFLRQNNEFDKAISVYEDILKEDYRDAEAHWGLVLSKYGIEYVKDPNTGEHMPTCHRTQRESVLLDVDYRAAIEFSDKPSGQIYKKEAKKINEIQKRILEISEKEPPYDIFICYKESDDRGCRTEDSVLAQELYQELQKRNYKVFFARKTLESKLGKEYEPIIFAALNSAKVMIVLGTKPEHFNAVWVKNEWGRFRKMVSEEEKIIIPVYRNMSPYELPEELASLQAQDMSKLGFMQELLDGIERIIKQKRGDDTQRGAKEKLIQNANTYLQLGNYGMADETFIRVTKEYPEDYRGWWGKIICQTRAFSQLSNDNDQLNTWFSYVKQLASSTEFLPLQEKYCVYIEKIACKKAEREINEINDLMAKKQNSINILRQDISNIEGTKDSLVKKYAEAFIEEQETEKICQKNVRDTMKQLNIKKKTILGGRIGIIISVICWGFYGVLVFLCGGESAIVNDFGIGLFVLGACAFIITILLYGMGKEKKVLITETEEAKNALEVQQMKMKDQKNMLDSQIVEEDKKITERNKKISKYMEEIKKGKRYLDLGTERISALHYAKECRKIGVQQEFDKEANDYQKAVFEEEH